MTQNGQRPVLDQQGSEIQAVAQRAVGRFRQDGFINQAGNAYALGMSQPDSLDEMVKVGNNLFKPNGSDRSRWSSRSEMFGRDIWKCRVRTRCGR